MKLKKLAAAAAISVLCTGNAMAKDYWGAELYTNEDYQYGRFEARMKMAASSGTVSSMFLYYNDSYMATNPWVEVDIEILGKNPGSFQSNIITGNANAKVTSEKYHTINPSASENFHVYAMEWTDKYVAWFLDGKEVRRSTEQVRDLVKRQDLRFNIWAPIPRLSDWVGNFNANALPLYQYIDWVKVYDYVPGQGNYGSDNNFKLKYADDFDGNDLHSRWSTADWSFDENNVDLKPDNVAVRNGYAIIGLTRANQGVVGANIPMPNDPNKGLQASTPASSSSSVPQVKSSSSSVVKSSSSVQQPVFSSSVQQPTISSSSEIFNGITATESFGFKAEVKNSTLMLNIPSTSDISWDIMSALGKVLMKGAGSYNAGSHAISIEKLPAGQYFLNIRLNNKKQSLMFKKM